MARKIRAKLIMELREQGLSRRKIGKARCMSMKSVCDVFDIAFGCDISWVDVKNISENDPYRLFYLDEHALESIFKELDWKYVHKEMAKADVDLRLLDDEHKEKHCYTGKVAMDTPSSTTAT